MPEEFENGGFTLKTHNEMFPFHTTPEEFKNAAIISEFGFVFEESSDRETTRFSRRHCLQNVFGPRENEKPAFSNSSSLTSVLEKLCFPDGLVWTVGLTVETKLRFQIAAAWCGRCLTLSIQSTDLVKHLSGFLSSMHNTHLSC